MTWEIALGVFALLGTVGSFAGICIKVVVPLTKSIVELTSEVKMLRKEYEQLDTKRRSEHKALWEHNEKQDLLLDDHAKRLHDLDGK